MIYISFLADYLVIDHGEIVEQATHQEQLQLNGYYARLNKHQEGVYAVG